MTANSFFIHLFQKQQLKVELFRYGTKQKGLEGVFLLITFLGYFPALGTFVLLRKFAVPRIYRTKKLLEPVPSEQTG
jgi:hypothetical protein